MTIRSYRLPNGAIPVLLSSDTAKLLRGEAAALLSYATSHPDVDAQAIAGMLFRTRVARKHRLLAMVTDRDELLNALQSVIDGTDHPLVVRSDAAATPRRVGYVFPGQGNQRPGMGRLFYESNPEFRTEVNRCAEAFQAHTGESPLNYLLDEHFPAEDNAGTVQPALFTQMAGLAALWRSFDVTPNVTVGHSQGEIAAAYISGAITLADAVRVVTIRARAADEFASGDYAMAVVAAGRDSCEDVLARCSGWAQLSVVNSPNMVGISGDSETVQGIVDAFTERDIFARVIRVQFPAHTSLINELGDKVLTATQQELANPKFLDTEIDCVGATLGGLITQDVPVDRYWFWNLRNTVRFDKAIAAAVPLGVDTFVELAEHPTLQLAIQENLAAIRDRQDEDHPMVVVGTSNRNATNLGEFTRNLAQLAVHDLDFSWDQLCSESDGPTPLPLLDFPNTLMNEATLWLPFVAPPPESTRPPAVPTPVTVSPVTAAADSETMPPGLRPPRLLAEEWIRLSRRSLLPPRSIGIVDHTGGCSELAAALCTAAGDIGATARLIGTKNGVAASDINAHVVLVPQSPSQEPGEAATAVATFFSDRAWWHGVDGAVTDCWLVTVGGEAVVADDAPPDPIHAAIASGFRCVGAEHPRVNFRHVDLPAGLTSADAAAAIVSALHTGQEAELALRAGGLYAKRVVEIPTPAADSAVRQPQHVLIVGGTGNLGLDFCEHFARAGARRITLVSRSGETAAVADRLRGIRAATATDIEAARCDIGDPSAVAALARQNQDTPADLIIHAAVQYSGMELAQITAEQVDVALRAKVAGIARVLDTFPRNTGARVFLCSSVAATVGGRGLIIYAASNRMLDAMAHRLRADGVDCVSVQWGQWQVKSDPNEAGLAKLTFTGLLPMSAVDALALGMSPLRSNAMVAAFDLDRARSVLGTCGQAALVSELSEPKPRPAPTAAAPAVSEAAPPGLSQRLVGLLAEAIGADSAEQIDTTIPMVAIGLDSLQALELRRRVKLEFDYDIEIVDLLGGASVADLLAKLEA